MGKWHRLPRRHVHEFPRYASMTDDIMIGDEYECSCGARAMVGGIVATDDGDFIEWMNKND